MLMVSTNMATNNMCGVDDTAVCFPKLWFCNMERSEKHFMNKCRMQNTVPSGTGV